MSDEINNTPNADELREQIRAEVRAEYDAQKATLDKLIAEEIASAPEALKKLLPEALPAADQVAWLRKAKAAGFGQTVPATDTRRPNNAAAAPDASSLSPIARIATGYKSSKN